jgi:uncharacterized membrane protein
MNKRKAIISTVLTIMLVGLAAWAFGFFTRTDPAIAKLQEIGDQMQDKNLSDAQRNQLRDDFRQNMRSMTDDQRRAFFDSNRDQWTGRIQQRMDEYFAMSKADQQKRLDEILNRMVQGRNSAQQNTNSGNRNANNNRGSSRNMSDAQREQRSKERLDRTSPKMRAQFAEFRKQLENRAQQRGVQMGDQRWGGFGGYRSGA